MKKFVYFMIIPVLVLSLAGCASTKSGKPRKKDIKTRVDVLETRVDDIEQKQATAVAAPSAEQYSASTPVPRDSGDSVSVGSSGSKMDKRDIQTALKNAGFYAGNIDGKIGPKTRQSIKDFQSANGLKADGVVGPKTLKALQRYL